METELEIKVAGGDKLKKRLEDMAKSLAKARSVRVGFLENANYPDGTSIALVAAVNEFRLSAASPAAPVLPRHDQARSGTHVLETS
jgi:hypothetical protein